MGSGKKTTKQTQKYTPPSWIESSAQQAAGLASNYAKQPYRPYSGDRVAGLTSGQEEGIALARDKTGAYEPDLASARGALDDMQNFTEADMGAYMNPYIESALNPAARELREEGLRRRNDRSGQLDMAGAFGSRAALALREEDEMTNQGLSDLYAGGYSQAFDRGSDLWRADQDRKLQQSGKYMELAGLGSDLVSKDVQRLMETGEVERQVDQQMKDFDYQQFIEKRDWGGRQAAYLTDVLRGLKGSYSETTSSKTETKESGNVLGQVLGVAATVAGAYFSGGATLAMQGAAKAAKATAGEEGVNIPGYSVASGIDMGAALQ